VKGFVSVIFATVHVGRLLGGLPRLALDRAGVALLVGGERTLPQAGAAVAAALLIVFVATRWPRDVAATSAPVSRSPSLLLGTLAA